MTTLAAIIALCLADAVGVIGEAIGVGLYWVMRVVAR